MRTNLFAVLLMVAVALWMLGCQAEGTKTVAPEPAAPAAVEPAPEAPAAMPEPAMPEPTQAVSVIVPPTAETSPFLTAKNFVTTWLCLGPFKFEATDFGGGQQQAAADKAWMPDEAALDGAQKAPEGTAWKEMTFKGGVQDGQCDLDALYGGIDNAAAYAVAWLVSPADMNDAKLLVGSDDYITVWVNGKQVHQYKTQRRGSTWDQDTVENIQLKKGYNRVVVKVTDVVSGWDFYLRLTNKDGMPMTFQAK